MDPVCVVNIRQADNDKVVEVERGHFNFFRPFSRTHSLYVARLAKIPRPPTRRTEIDHRMNEVEEQLADHVDRIRHMVRRRCQRYNISTADSIYDHDPFLTGRGQLSPNMSLALSPNIWFQCRSGWVKDIIQKEIGGISWTQHYGLGNKIHVGLPAAVLAANPSTPVPRHLRLDHSGFKMPYDYELFLNIQMPLGDSPPSACGLVCSVAVKKGDALVHHSTCKIGGILSIKDSNGIDRLVGLTSGHALLDMYLTTDMEDTDTLSSLGPDSGTNSWPSLLSWALGSKGSVKQCHAATPASTEEASSASSNHDPNERSTKESSWQPVNSIYSINWMGGGWESIAEFQFPFAIPQPDKLCPDADFALLQIPGEFANLFYTGTSVAQHVVGFRTEAEMTGDKVGVILGLDNIMQGTVLWGRQNLHIRGIRFPARKIQLKEALSAGASGSWVVQDGLLCGMIALVYEDEPFAYMITAEKLVSDIKKTLGSNIEVSLPPVEEYSSKLGILPILVTPEAPYQGAYKPILRSKSILDREPFIKMRLQLRREGLRSAVHERTFIPLDAIHRVTQHDVVREEFGKIFLEIDKLSNYIQNTATRLFAILVLINKPEVIQDCFYENLYDSDLPVNFHRHSAPQVHGFVERLNVENSDERTRMEINLFRQWDEDDADLFCANQNRVLVPVFTQGADGQPLVYKLRPSTALPFTDRGLSIKGAFSTVTQVRIHPAHHDFNISGSGCFAMKTLHVSSEAVDLDITYKGELEAHGRLYKEPRLCTMVAALERQGELSILMPWADGGNLNDLWKRHAEAPPATRVFLEWFLRECLGLAQGLSAIHSPWERVDVSDEYQAKLFESAKEKTTRRGMGSPPWEFKQGDGPGDFLDHVQDFEGSQLDGESAEQLKATKPLVTNSRGRHGDIKPGNILCFYESGGDVPNQSDYGVLKLSDFGTTTFGSFSPSETRSFHVGFTATYRAPEVGNGTSITQLSDMWSFGCVLLEFATWLLLGLSGVESFADARMATSSRITHLIEDCFFSAHEHQDEVKPSVTAWTSMLRRECLLREELRDMDVLADFLTYIEERLLVVDVEKRETAAALVDFLTQLSSRLTGPESPLPVQSDTAARAEADAASDVLKTHQPEVEATDVVEILHAGSTKDGQTVIMASRSEHPVPASEHEELEEAVVQTIEEHIEEIRTKETYTRRTQRRTTVFNANRAALLTRAALAQRALEGKSVGHSKEEMLATLRLLPAGELAEEQASLEMRLEAISELQREAQQMAVKEGAGTS